MCVISLHVQYHHMSGLRYFPLKIGNTENLCYSNFVKGLYAVHMFFTHRLQLMVRPGHPVALLLWIS